MKSYAPGFVLVAIVLAIDLYTFKGLRLLTQSLHHRLRLLIHVGYWSVTAGAIAATIWLTANITEVQDARDYQTFFTLAGLVMLVVAPKLIFVAFHGADDLYYLLSQLRKPKADPDADVENGKGVVTRAKFLTQVGLGMAALPFTGMVYGMLEGRFDFRVTKNTASFPNLPQPFSGLRIVQISDAHLGSFYRNFKAVEQAFEMVQELRPDILVFSGDMVNNYGDEVDGWEPYFTKLEARYGKYAILGNHDYGDYVAWPSLEAKTANLQYLKRKIKSMGFNLLLNSNDRIEIDGASIGIIGVENWGHGRFSKYGDLEKAMRGMDEPFKLLLSHDPTHWEEQVMGKTDIDLTLSGHTHGMQFGIEVPGIKWSPAQYRYPRWGGLYREGAQHLYVNRGFGYIGFPGRVGISPEITLLELRKGPVSA